MNDIDFLAQAMRYQDGVLTPDELAAFEAAMRDDPSKRQLFADTQLRSMALHDRFRQQAFQRVADIPVSIPAPRRFTWITRPITAMAAGLVIGLFCASVAWAISTPKMVTEQLFSLLNGSFSENRLERDFPRRTGIWSGDETAIRDGRLHFIAPGSDPGDPYGIGISCDVFQLVDLRPLREELSDQGESLLELSASFQDTRPAHATPSVTSSCKLFLFSGDLAAIGPHWPQAVASGSAQVVLRGMDGKGERRLTAKCLVPTSADFAVIQISARPHAPPPPLDGIFSHDVSLTLKDSPQLPIRLVQR